MTHPPLDGDETRIAALAAALSGRYAIRRLLGAGGMALVYLAEDVQRGRLVALKVLKPDVASLDASERFLREIRTVAQLVHPNILPLLDSGESDGQLWFTTPFIEGESLREHMNRARQLSVDESIRLTREIADALSYAHGKSILHRDIKPENILLADGHALVADFGIARAIAGEMGERLTGTGVAVGTPAYMSPEQSAGERELDARSDVYALGAVCYEMLAGEPPFTGPTAQAVIARRLSQPPPSLRTTRPGIADGIDAAIRRALASAPVDRFGAAGEFARALITAATAAAPLSPGHLVHASNGEAANRGAMRRRTIVTATLLIAGAVIALIAFASRALVHRTEPPALSHGGAGGIRLAVLPFGLIGGDSADRYLADGLSEEVNATLANLNGLRVIAQSSVLSVTAKETRPKKIGAALDADALISGDVQHAGNMVRVRVRGINPATEDILWTKQFDHTTQDVFRIQSEVAQQVAALLRIQLAAGESRSLGRPLTTNPAAYDLYLRARTLAARPNSHLRARYDTTIAQLTRAITLDSSFAAAWALRADERADAAFYFDTDRSNLDEADIDIRHALALDSNTVRAWEARSNVAWTAARGWNFPDALAAAHRATVIQPSDVGAHETLGSLYLHYGFMKEAGVEFATSLSLDPRDGCETSQCVGFSPPRVARVFWYRQQFDSALAIYRRFPAGAGGFAWEYAVVLGATGRPADGLALLDSTRRPGVAEGYDREAARGLMYAMLGRSDEALAQLRAAAERPQGRSHFHHAQFTIASAYARLGDKHAAVEWLRGAADNGMPNYPLFRNDPNMKILQGDGDYETLMTRIKEQFDANARLVQGVRMASAGR